MWNHRIGVLSTLAVLLFSVPSFADSRARIVRLSYVEGDVQIDRNTGQSFEKAFLNVPLIQGARLRTGFNGFAEVEFEDGSTLRLTSGTQVSFPQLELRESGAKASTADLQRGMVYVSFAGTKHKDDEFALTFGPGTAALATPVHFRLEMEKAKASLAVFKGDLEVNGPSGVAMAGSKETLNFDLTDHDQYRLAKKVEEAPYDAWDKEQDDYRQRYARNNAWTNSPSVYGLSDLGYYGSFFNVAGYGMMWQPFFVGAGWDPFMDGAWAWYPGVGYSWVSAYPWGWAPFHYGAWQYLAGYGWVWQPGGTWAGLSNPLRTLNPPVGFKPVQPPATPVRSLVVVSRGAASAAAPTADGIRIRNNSAGLGIPRGSLGNLNRMSVHVEQRGFATATFLNPPAAAMYNPAISGSSVRGATAPEWSAATRSTPVNQPSASPQGMAAPSFHAGSASASGGSHGSGGARGK